MRQRLSALGLCAVVGLLGAYLLVRAVELFGTGRPAGTLLGIGVLLLVLVGGLLVAGEIRFGLDSQRLGERLGREGGLPALPPDLPRLPSGRVRRDAADALFAERKAEVEAAPRDWRAWFRLADAYGLARDTPRGRRALRTAIRLEREEREPTDRPDRVRVRRLGWPRRTPGPRRGRCPR